MKKNRKSAKIIREKDAVKEMCAIGVNPHGLAIMRDKTIFRMIKLFNIKPALANIIKEDMLSAGGEAAIHKLSCACRIESTDILLMGTITHYKHLLKDLAYQPYGGKEVSNQIKKALPLE